MSLEPRLLRAFVAVAEENHFGRAARRLGISQPPLSLQIQKLEAEVGVRLFERDRRSVALTEAGRFLLERARRLLVDGERAAALTRRIAEGAAGVLSVGYAATATHALLPALVKAYRAARPDVRVELVELRSPEQAEALRRGRIEIGLACGPTGWPGERVLLREKLLVAMARGHRLGRRSRLRPRDLSGLPFVLVRRDVEPAWADASAEALRAAGCAIDVAQETDTKIAMLGLVAADVGVSVVSESTASLRRDGVVLRPLELGLRLPLVLLCGDVRSPRAEAFCALACGQSPTHGARSTQTRRG